MNLVRSNAYNGALQDPVSAKKDRTGYLPLTIFCVQLADLFEILAP